MVEAGGGSWLVACADESTQQMRSADEDLINRTECFGRGRVRNLLFSFALSLRTNLNFQRYLITRLRQIFPILIAPSRFAHLDYLLQYYNRLPSARLLSSRPRHPA